MPFSDPGVVVFPAIFLIFFGFLFLVILLGVRQHARSQAAALELERDRLEAQVALKRELIQRNLPPHELEQALKLLKLDEELAGTPGKTAARTEPQLVAAIAEYLAVLDGISPDELESILGLVRAADRETKEATIDLLANLAEHEPGAEVVLASVRSLCRPVDMPRTDGPPLELSTHITR
jgi:hypothetical protein